MKEIVIRLSQEQYNQLVRELHSLYSYHQSDDYIHSKDCGSKIVNEIESQKENQEKALTVQV